MVRGFKLSDVEHDAFVKAVDAGVDPRKIRVGPGSSSRRRSSRSSGPGWAQLLINDLGRVLSSVNSCELQLKRLESLFREFVLDLSASGASGSGAPREVPSGTYCDRCQEDLVGGSIDPVSR